jgi:hypothetical protein
MKMRTPWEGLLQESSELKYVRSLPGIGPILAAVVVNGQLAECCGGGGADEAGLRAAGVGSPL